MAWRSNASSFDPTERIYREAKTNFEQEIELGAVLGKGTNIVKKAKIKSSRQEVAVKLFDKANKTANHRSIVNEVEILHKLQGAAHVVVLREVYEDKETLYIVLDLYGTDLLEQIKQNTFFKEDDGREIMRSVAEAIVYLHSKSVIHADLRPEKVLVGPDFAKNKSSVFLSDFGQAKVLEEGQKISKSSGARSYMAPEIIKGERFSFPVDCWALGVTFYVILGGYKPFDNPEKPSDPSLNQQILTGKVVFHEEEWKHVGSSAKDLISQLLVVDEKKRLTAPQLLKHAFFTATKRASGVKHSTSEVEPSKSALALNTAKSNESAKDPEGSLSKSARERKNSVKRPSKHHEEPKAIQIAADDEFKPRSGSYKRSSSVSPAPEPIKRPESPPIATTASNSSNNSSSAPSQAAAKETVVPPLSVDQVNGDKTAKKSSRKSSRQSSRSDNKVSLVNSTDAPTSPAPHTDAKEGDESMPSPKKDSKSPRSSSARNSTVKSKKSFVEDVKPESKSADKPSPPVSPTASSPRTPKHTTPRSSHHRTVSSNASPRAEIDRKLSNVTPKDSPTHSPRTSKAKEKEKDEKPSDSASPAPSSPKQVESAGTDANANVNAAEVPNSAKPLLERKKTSRKSKTKSQRATEVAQRVRHRRQSSNGNSEEENKAKLALYEERGGSPSRGIAQDSPEKTLPAVQEVKASSSAPRKLSKSGSNDSTFGGDKSLSKSDPHDSPVMTPERKRIISQSGQKWAAKLQSKHARHVSNSSDGEKEKISNSEELTRSQSYGEDDYELNSIFQSFNVGNVDERLKEFEQLLSKSAKVLNAAALKIRALDADLDAIYYQTQNKSLNS